MHTIIETFKFQTPSFASLEGHVLPRCSP